MDWQKKQPIFLLVLKENRICSICVSMQEHMGASSRHQEHVLFGAELVQSENKSLPKRNLWSKYISYENWHIYKEIPDKSM